MRRPTAPELAKVLKRLEKGDVLIVIRLDRLTRSTHTWADTTTPHGRSMLTVLGSLAEFEREVIKARTREGRKRAKAKA